MPRLSGGKVGRAVLAALAMLLALALAGCGNWPAPAPIPTPGRPSASPAPPRSPIRRGGRVTVGLAQEPATLNPAFGLTPAVAAVTRPLVEGLIDFDADGHPRPWLAEEVPTPDNGGVAEGGRVVTYKLRQGVAWDDGKPFTAADLVFTFAVFRDPGNPIAGDALAPFANLRAVDALDAYTVRLTYERPDATYLRAFATIYPAHLFDGRTRLVDDPYGRGPVGTGPFRFREWAPGDHLTLARNPIYREAGRPYLDELVFRFFPDAAAAAAALRAGEVDLLLDPATERLDDVLDAPDVAAHVWPGAEVAMLALNVAAPAEPGGPPPAFAAPALRRAVALALDRPALAAALPGGRWRPTASPIGDDPPAPPPAVPGADPAAAGRLLTGAGWAAGPDGVRRRSDQPLALTLLFPGDDPAARPIADGLRAQLAAAGVTLRAEGLPAAALLAPDGPARAGRFDLLLVTLPHGPEPLPMLRAAFGCSPPTPIGRAGPGPFNYGRWCNPDAARWLDLAAGAPDDAARANAERGLLGVVAAEAPVIPLVVRPGLLAYRAGLRGLAPGRWTPATWNAAVWWRER